MATFADFDVHPEVVERLKRDGITEPTEIQERSFEPIREGKDVMAESETGSGKTLAFGIPIMETVEGDRTQALILSPTRELAKQIAKEFKTYAPDSTDVVTIYGGVAYGPQIKGGKTANVVVGTPGRILDLLKQKKLDVSTIEYFVLDEADRMMDMGFQDELEGIMDFCPEHRQNLLFGATIPRQLRKMCDRYGIDPVEIRVEREHHTRNLDEYYIDVQSNRKISMLYTLLQKADSDLSLVFCRTKNTTRFVARALKHNGVNAAALNGDMSQHQREELVERFKQGEVQVVVATDVAARGLHIDDVSHVFNYDVPDTPDTYTHRIGRAGRQGAEGEAVTLLEKDQHPQFRRIHRDNKEIERIPRDSISLRHVDIP